MEMKMLAILCIVVFIAASVTAHSPYQVNTPLYTVRMEQACSKMHFLPSEMNEITYTAHQKYTFDYTIPQMGGKDITAQCTMFSTVDCTCFYYTCFFYTCTWPTCYYKTCIYDTCFYDTCFYETCYYETCNYYTCWPHCR